MKFDSYKYEILMRGYGNGVQVNRTGAGKLGSYIIRKHKS